jgi:hypothetical protein
MATYSVCFPKNWAVYKDAALDRVSGCNRKNGRCTGNGGGLPYPGVEFVFLMPAEKVPGHHYKNLNDIISSEPHISGQPVVAGEVKLSKGAGH